ncbi:MAG: MBOAT family O-acyltransferase [Desulfovibrionaceae bacterium]
MLFTTYNFWFFFIIIFALLVCNAYLFASVVVQNVILLISSYYFYAKWDYRFLLLIIFCTVINYLGSLYSKRYRYSVPIVVVLTLGILGIFKYYNFFIAEARVALSLMGFSLSEVTLQIILPVGISFYTFQALSYSIDVYKGRIEATRNLLHFATYIAFFPQLVAGPIERAGMLLPQFLELWKYDEDRILQGLRLIIMGLFYKIFIADSLAPFVNEIFSSVDIVSGSTLFRGAIYFAFQIYGDFFGYSTIAIGIAMIMGFELMTNFRTPYFSTSLHDFWHRWHISLSTFFRDYLYIPLGGSKRGRPIKYRNIFIVMSLSGLWHGANWTFIIWGIYHAVVLICEDILHSILGTKEVLVKVLLYVKWMFSVFRWLLVFMLILTSWVFFRADSMGEAIAYISKMYSSSLFEDARFGVGIRYVVYAAIMDFIIRRDVRLSGNMFSFLKNERIKVLCHGVFYSLLFWIIFSHINVDLSTDFLYFQF